jgi:hypothetical protein
MNDNKRPDAVRLRALELLGKTGRLHREANRCSNAAPCTLSMET